MSCPGDISETYVPLILAALFMMVSDATELLSKIDDMMEEEAKNLRAASEIIYQRHNEYNDRIHSYARNHEEDQSKILCLKGLRLI